MFPTDRLSLKLLAGRGFRAPAPSELFGANTYALASNIGELEPETIRTLEAAFDWAVAGNWIWRANIFHRQFNDQIAYSEQNFNLSTNLYSNTTTGVETEVLADLATGGSGRLQGFANYSLVQLLDETIKDENIAESNRLAWAPEHVGNIGLHFHRGRLDLSGQVHGQGPVRRRASDRMTVEYLALRENRVPAWASIDLRVAVKALSWAVVGVQGTNLLDQRAPLIKNNDYPFDYRSDGRRLFLTIDLR